MFMYNALYKKYIIIKFPMQNRFVFHSQTSHTVNIARIWKRQILGGWSWSFTILSCYSFQHLMSHLHLQPKESHDVDFSRVRMWTLNGWAKFYRQTLIFSQLLSPQILALYNKHCHSILHTDSISVNSNKAVGHTWTYVGNRDECLSL